MLLSFQNLLHLSNTERACQMSYDKIQLELTISRQYQILKPHGRIMANQQMYGADSTKVQRIIQSISTKRLALVNLAHNCKIKRDLHSKLKLGQISFTINTLRVHIEYESRDRWKFILESPAIILGPSKPNNMGSVKGYLW